MIECPKCGSLLEAGRMQHECIKSIGISPLRYQLQARAAERAHYEGDEDKANRLIDWLDRQEPKR
jgi:hypothetical protein